MAGCAKYDNIQEDIDKYVDIIKNAGVQSNMTISMEVTTCGLVRRYRGGYFLKVFL